MEWVGRPEQKTDSNAYLACLYSEDSQTFFRTLLNPGHTWKSMHNMLNEKRTLDIVASVEIE